MTDHEAMLAIQELMAGVEWSADTLDRIAAIMIDAGYRIRDCDDVDRDGSSAFDGGPVSEAMEFLNRNGGRS